MTLRSSDSRVTVRPLSIGLYLDERPVSARSCEVAALGRALRELGHRVVVYRVVSSAAAEREVPETDGGESLDHAPVRITLPEPGPGTPADRSLRTDLTVLVQQLASARARHDLHHAFDALTAQALLVAQPEAAVVRTVTSLGRGASSYHEHLSAHTVRAARAVVAPSHALCNDLAERYGVSAIQVDTGVDAEAFAMAKAGEVVALGAELGLDSAGPLLVTLGGLTSPAEAQRLVHAFAALHARHRGARWLCEAALPEHLSEPVRSTLAAALAQLPSEVRAAVRPARRFSAPERAAVYQLADVVACTSAGESHLSWLLEAQAAGAPMLLSHEASHCEYVDPRCAEWVAVGDDAALVRGLLRAAIAGRCDRRLVHVGAERAREYTWARSAAQHTSVYRHVVFEAHAGSARAVGA
jgi:glycosyltransferase involved in cell wall biosynthesis